MLSNFVHRHTRSPSRICDAQSDGLWPLLLSEVCYVAVFLLERFWISAWLADKLVVVPMARRNYGIGHDADRSTGPVGFLFDVLDVHDQWCFGRTKTMVSRPSNPIQIECLVYSSSGAEIVSEANNASYSCLASTSELGDGKSSENLIAVSVDGFPGRIDP